MFEFAFLALLIKMACAATLVVGASLVAEKTGPFMAGLVATFPVSAGPNLVFLSMAHDDAFIAATAHGSVGANVAVATFCATYAFAAQRFSTIASLGCAFLGWFLALVILNALQLPFLTLLALNVAAYLCYIPLCRRFAEAVSSAAPVRAWYAVPLRAGGVALLVALVTGLSTQIGPLASGVLAVFPIVMCSLIVILQPRIGGKASAAVITNSLPGMLGFGLALATVHFAALPLGRWWALALGLAVSSLWNGGLVAFRSLWRRRRARFDSPATSS